MRPFVDSRTGSGRALLYEIISAGSGLALALFMFGHMLLVGSILTGKAGFEWVAVTLTNSPIEAPIFVLITVLFLVHAIFAGRKIPVKFEERRQLLKLGRGLWTSNGFSAHTESLLWLWQVRTGMVILLLGTFHLILIGIDIFTPLFGERTGIEAETTLAREQAGLWMLYAVFIICIAFHTAAGLFHMAIKWGVGSRLTRRTLRVCEHVILWVMLGFGGLTLTVMSGLVSPPLAFLIGAAP